MIERLRVSDREIADAVTAVEDDVSSMVQTARMLTLLVRDRCGLA
jgi:hypothetical protein